MHPAAARIARPASLPVLLLAALFAVAAAPACALPTQHDQARWGTEKILLGAPNDPNDAPWRSDQLAELRAEIPALSALGPTVTEADAGEEGDPAVFVLRPFDSQAADPMHRPCGAGAGRWIPGSNQGECDPVCCHGYPQLRQCLGHEWGHANALGHVCAPRVADATCDPRVPTDYAVMNSLLGYDDPGGALGGVDSSGNPVQGVDPGAVASPEPTLADLTEWNATHHADAGP